MKDFSIIDILQEMARMFEADIGPFTLNAYFKALSGFDPARLAAAAEKIVLNRGQNDRFPTVNSFLEAMGETPVSDRSKAIDTANRMWKAVSALGWVATQEKLSAMIGEVGLYVAKAHGGWRSFCSETEHIKDSTFFKNQLAKEVEMYFEKSSKGCLDMLPSFDEAARNLPGNKKTLEALDIAMGRKTDGQKQIKGETETDA